MAVKLLIPGQREPAAPYRATLAGVRSAEAGAPATDLLDNVEVVHAFNLSPIARSAAGDRPEAVELQDDDILEIEVEGGFTVWTSASRYRERTALLAPDAVEGGTVAFGALVEPSTAERGIKDWTSSALRVLRVRTDRIVEALKDPTQWPDFFRGLLRGRAESLGAWATAKLLMHLIERQLTPGPGLYRWSGAPDQGPADLAAAQPVPAADVSADRPVLLFVHGTASRTLGSFGALAGSEARLHWRVLREHYGDQIYAFEHRTMSDSPIDNAIELLETLPEGARLHLVSHSRGGLVGDLLCLTGLDDDQIDRYRRRDEALAEADDHDRAQLRRLQTLIRTRRVRVERYVRVACPARGTLLASDNIDEFLSILTNLIGLIPGLGASPIYQVVKRITLEVVRNRMDPALIPGVEAMIPESPLVALLNTSAKAGDRLAVIAGDIEGGNWLKRLGVFVTDRYIYEGRDNDLVVNTDSMFHGARRGEPVHFLFHQGSTVSHFNYFRNEPTRAALVRWLTVTDRIPDEFHPLPADGTPPVPTLRALRKRAPAGTQPVAIVLPGIMGSTLARDDDRIWLDWFDLLLGGLGRLRDVDDARIAPAGLLGDYYGTLCEQLAQTHEVIPFAYDWRRSIHDAAARLAVVVEGALAGNEGPIRLVAHSMGGLVVRALIGAHPALWQRICDRPGSRLLMLGTPNRGSHAMAETLVGMAKTIRQLALLDVRHSREEILSIIGAFPGALELLPEPGGEGEPDWYATGTWSAFRDANEGSGCVPDARALAAALAARTALPPEIPQADRVVYVAGMAAATPCGLEVDAHGRLMLLTTDAGDGKVTHAAGRLPGVATWFAPAEHGDLPAHEASFAAYLDLLEDGRTARLPTSAPGVRGTRGRVPWTRESVLYPTERDFVAGLLGSRPRPWRARRQEGFTVRVVHADLRHASHPVMVGHYEGDTIVGAEAYLDDRLDGALSRRYALGIYPGPLGTSEVVLRDPGELQRTLGIPRGAVVVGLGRMGDLAPATLADAVRRGALEYLVQAEGASCGDEGDHEARDLGLSVLLIGTNSAANVTVDDSVGALLRGIAQANREIALARGTTCRIARVEILELYADLAILATHALKRVAPSIASDLDMRIEADGLLASGRGGRIRVTPTLSRNQWRRWIVTAERRAAGRAVAPVLPAPLLERIHAALADPATVDTPAWSAVLGLAFPGPDRAADTPVALSYVALSDRARAEVRVQSGQPQLIERLVRNSIHDTRYSADTARTLFELMVPNALKDGLAQQARLVMVADDETSAYPWELMSQGGKPICVEIGFVRQLQTARFRPQIRATTIDAAYVVGDPRTAAGVPPLPAAAAEARQVAALLSDDGFQVTHLAERPGAREVLDGLFSGPYRILHVAGHGHFEPRADGTSRSGLLLEDGLYLTAAEIGQMRQVPDLVFLNCCHLAQLGKSAPPGPTPEFNRLAASISRELIEMGVRAVVAAGWAVRDDAAQEFAAVFYRHMLARQTFGDALLEARRRTWERFPDCNTWGAYQAYGDPDFRLKVRSQQRRSPAPGDWVAPQEWMVEMEAEIGRHREAAAKGPQSAEGICKRLDALMACCPADWLERGDVLACAGAAYAEVGEFERSASLLRKAVEGEDTGPDASFRTVELLANLEARWGERRKDAALVRAAIARLEKLVAVVETGERLSLLGSAHKRLAQISEGRSITAALTDSARWYRRAAERKAAAGEIDPYPVLNWLTVAAVLGEAPADAGNWLARVRAAARERYARTRAPWDAIALPDANMVESLIEGRLDDAAATAVVAEYREALREAAASERELDSVLNQLRFIESMAPRTPAGTAIAAGAKRLRELLGAKATARTAAAPGDARTASGTNRAARPAKQSAARPAQKRPAKRPGATGSGGTQAGRKPRLS